MFPIDDYHLIPVEKIIMPFSYCAPFIPPELLHTHYI